MYETPPTSLHIQLAKQRQHDLLAEAQRANVPSELRSDSEHLLAVKSVFAGVAAAVSSLMRPKPAAAQTVATNGC
jgi:hypothetical protein